MSLIEVADTLRRTSVLIESTGFVFTVTLCHKKRTTDESWFLAAPASS